MDFLTKMTIIKVTKKSNQKALKINRLAPCSIRQKQIRNAKNYWSRTNSNSLSLMQQ